MLILLTCRLSLKLWHVGLKPRLLGQIIEKPCIDSRGHICDPKFMKICLNVNPRSRSKLGLVGSDWVKN